MRNIKLASNDSGEFELGLTQDPSEITNKNGFRVLVKFTDEKPTVIGIEQVSPSGVWEVVASESFASLLNGVMEDNIKNLDFDQLKANQVFYVEILKNVAGDPFRGILAPLEEMGKIIDAPNPHIEESRFVRDYAIFFLQHYATMCGVDKDYPDKYIAAMKRWSTEVASLNTPVDVVETTASGKTILFTIPAALASNDIFNNDRGLEIHEIIYEASFIGQTDPAGAETYIESNFSNKLDAIPIKELKGLDRSRVEIFDYIRERYSIERWLPKAEVETKPTEAGENNATKPADTQEGFGDDEMGQF